MVGIKGFPTHHSPDRAVGNHEHTRWRQQQGCLRRFSTCPFGNGKSARGTLMSMALRARAGCLSIRESFTSSRVRPSQHSTTNASVKRSAATPTAHKGAASQLPPSDIIRVYNTGTKFNQPKSTKPNQTKRRRQKHCRNSHKASNNQRRRHRSCRPRKIHNSSSPEWNHNRAQQ